MGFDCKIRDIGLIDYDKGYIIQEQAVRTVLEGGEQTLIFCEHFPIITLGRLANIKNIFSIEECEKRGVQIKDINRGGDVTLHSPGQLVIYSIMNLHYYGKDLRKFLFMLEQVAIDVLDALGVSSMRMQGKTGVYVGDKKIVSIGIGVKQWVSFHGLALNINNEMSLYRLIRPCNLDVEMISLKDIYKKEKDISIIKSHFVSCFCRVFNLNYI